MRTNGYISISKVAINFTREGFLDDANVSSNRLSRVRNGVNLLGIDLFMFATGDLHPQEQEVALDTVDLRRAAGLYNYAQAITHRLMTARGTHPEDSFFGVPWFDYLGHGWTSRDEVRVNLMQDITDELYKDNRTKEVLSIDVEFLDVNTIHTKCAVSSIQDEGIEISFDVGSVGADA